MSVIDEKELFKQLLHELLDARNYPIRGRVKMFCNELESTIPNVRYEMVRKWLAGVSMPEKSKYPKIAHFFGITVDELIHFSDGRQIREASPKYNDQNGIKFKLVILPLKTWKTVEEKVNPELPRIDTMIDKDIKLSEDAFVLNYEHETVDWKDPVILVFDTQNEEESDYWCAKLPTDKEASLKRVTVEGGENYFSSANVRLNDELILADQFKLRLPVVARSFSPPK